MAPDSEKPAERVTQKSRGYCPVCGADVVWTPTAHLWPTRKSAHAVLPGQSGACSHCHRVLMYTVMNEPAADADGTSI
jgi:hypothetical protein